MNKMLIWSGFPKFHRDENVILTKKKKKIQNDEIFLTELNPHVQPFKTV